MGFGIKWRKWIDSCLSSASILILVNGSPSKEFKMEMGLHQGDPLSPFLFFMVAEALQISILEACVKGPFKGVGKKMRYVDGWAEVTNRFRKRLSSWKANILSIGGRLTLVKSVLDSQRGISWVKWDSILADAKNGGLGVGSLLAKNLSLLGKWKWSMIGEHHVWNSWIPKKVNICTWRASLNRHLTRSNLAIRGVALPSFNCPLCNEEVESLEHCIINCPRVLPIWRKIWSWWNLVSPSVFPSFTIEDIVKNYVKANGCSRTNKALNGVLHCTIWSIWKWRNKVSHADPDLVSKVIDEDIFPAI
ncbi:RNA-directed DNA polymerase, eukaryota, reverse transcriptase zinc-binding domain protein [Tanacetum coccineum]